LKLLLGQHRSTLDFLGFFHIHVLPFVFFVGPKVILFWIELE
jgi:hypothetical protein